MSEGALVQAVAEQAQGENAGREGIARRLGISAKGFRQEAGAVFCIVVREGEAQDLGETGRL